MKEGSAHHVVVIAGPTGSGESAITNELIRRYPTRMTRLITATTRSPRSGEQEGVDYYFFTKEEFFEKQKAGQMLEYTHHANRDVYYGSYAPDLEEKIATGHIVIVNPDVIGAKYYKENYGATTIFITPKSVDELVARIRKRNPEMSEHELANRKQSAEHELRDEQPFYDFVVMNQDGGLEQATDEIVGILTHEGYTLN